MLLFRDNSEVDLGSRDSKLREEITERTHKDCGGGTERAIEARTPLYCYDAVCVQRLGQSKKSDNLAWPRPLAPSLSKMKIGSELVSVLSPAAILFSTMKRIRHSMASTRPATMIKGEADRHDVGFLLNHTSPNVIKEGFEKYPADQGARIIEDVKAATERYLEFAPILDAISEQS